MLSEENSQLSSLIEESNSEKKTNFENSKDILTRNLKYDMNFVNERPSRESQNSKNNTGKYKKLEKLYNEMSKKI